MRDKIVNCVLGLALICFVVLAPIAIYDIIQINNKNITLPKNYEIIHKEFHQITDNGLKICILKIRDIQTKEEHVVSCRY